MIECRIEGGYLVIELQSVADTVIRQLVVDSVAAAREKEAEAQHWKDTLHRLVEEWDSGAFELQDFDKETTAKRSREEAQRLVADLLAGRQVLE